MWPGAIVDDYTKPGMDDTYAFQKAVEAGLGLVAFGARQYALDNTSGPIDTREQAVIGVSNTHTLLGMKDATQSLLIATTESVLFRDFAIVLPKTAPLTSGAAAISLVRCGGRLERLAFDGPWTATEALGFVSLHHEGCSAVNIDGEAFVAVGPDALDGSFAFNYSHDSCRVENSTGRAFVTKGSVSSPNFYRCATRNTGPAFHISAPTLGPPSELVHIVLCTSDHDTLEAVRIEAATSARVLLGHYEATSGPGVYLGDVAGAEIIGNDLSHNGQTGITLDGATGVLISLNDLRTDGGGRLVYTSGQNSAEVTHTMNPGLNDGAG